MITATAINKPFTINWYWVDTCSRFSMLLINPTMIEPIKAPVTVPIPPKKLVPPTITAVMASNSYPSPTEAFPPSNATSALHLPVLSAHRSV